MAKGYLIINVYGETIANPVKNANIRILKNNNEVMRTTTNEDGQTNTITLETVDESYTEEKQSKVKPYETYDIEVTAFGLTPTKLNGVQIFDNVTSFQDIYLTSIDENQNQDVSTIDSNSLWENESQNQTDEETASNGISLFVLRQVVVPQTIVVHDGAPSNTNAANYTVPFTDYIKNVASSEIYATWPKETIKANVLAIISFTLNRIYTEWYRSRGYNFTITSTTSYDQKYTRNGTIFEPISKVVDEIFTNYITSGVRMEPLLAPYRSETSTKGILSQWGSKELGDRGYSALEILRYYYGNDINIYTAIVSGEYPYSFTTTLKEGDCSSDIYLLQNALNYIHGSYPGIPLINKPTGYYDRNTTNAVKTFQKVFSLQQNGQANYETWYKISYILTAVEKLTATAF